MRRAVASILSTETTSTEDDHVATSTTHEGSSDDSRRGRHRHCGVRTGQPPPAGQGPGRGRRPGRPAAAGAAPPGGVRARAAPCPVAGGLTPEAMAQLQQLADLNKSGVLTDEEFAAQKARILGG